MLGFGSCATRPTAGALGGERAVCRSGPGGAGGCGPLKDHGTRPGVALSSGCISINFRHETQHQRTPVGRNCRMAALAISIELDELLGLGALALLDKVANGGPNDIVTTAEALMRSALAIRDR